MVLALVAAACGGGTTATTEGDAGGGPAPTAQPPADDAPADEEPAAEGGILTIGLYQEPDNLNPYLAVQTASRLVRELTLEGLLAADPDGNFIPELAAEVPSVENGGISADGLTITYKLREGVTWSDGDPFTSADVKFTWEAIMDDANAVNSQSGYELIESIETPDDLTVVVKFSELYAPALSLFSIADAILPAHELEGVAFPDAEFNRLPEGTGPFVITEWRSGDSIVFDRSPNFREAGKPILDRVVFKIIPSREVGIAQIRAGEVDVLWDLIESQIPEFQALEGIDLQVVPSSNVEYLGLNLADTFDPAVPHPILADKRVRDALAAAIDRTPIVDELLFGMTTVATSPIGMGWAAPEGMTLPPYDPEKAKALLEEAGWVDTDGDGIRERDGMTLTLEISTPAGSQLRELSQQILQAQFAAVGIELVINNVPAATLFGNWQENGKLKRGDFDIVMDTWGPDLDPDAFLSTLFSSDQIPMESNDGEGWNFVRLVDPELDAAIVAGRSTLDLDARKASYRTVVERILAAGVYIPLYNRSRINAFSSVVAGELPNSWDNFTWNIADWSLDR
jgi:peptide/nickel transport system substrate-binding protein